MAKSYFIQLALLGFGLFSSACEVDNPCQTNDPDLVEKFGVPEHQTEGADGICYVVDPAVKNWGSACDSIALCGGGLICAAPQMPICTAIDCNPDNTKDKVCGEGFMCIATGESTPTICVPMPAPMPSASTESSSESQGPSGDAGTGDGGDETTSGESTEDEVAPNVGTACTSATDPVCVGGTFCEAQSLMYCTLANCAEGLENAAACADVGFCYSTAPAPATGICTVQ